VLHAYLGSSLFLRENSDIAVSQEVSKFFMEKYERLSILSFSFMLFNFMFSYFSLYLSKFILMFLNINEVGFNAIKGDDFLHLIALYIYIILFKSLAQYA
jgi:hypothetical protein